MTKILARPPQFRMRLTALPEGETRGGKQRANEIRPYGAGGKICGNNTRLYP